MKRTVSHISWYPDGGRKLAVAFAIMQFQDWRMDKMSQKSYIWDVNNPNVRAARPRVPARLRAAPSSAPRPHATTRRAQSHTVRPDRDRAYEPRCLREA